MARFYAPLHPHLHVTVNIPQVISAKTKMLPFTAEAFGNRPLAKGRPTVVNNTVHDVCYSPGCIHAGMKNNSFHLLSKYSKLE